MAEEFTQSAQPARTIRRVSMVPHHSSYPRAPYAAQKNIPRATTRRPGAGKAIVDPMDAHQGTDLGADTALRIGHGSQGASAVPGTQSRPSASQQRSAPVRLPGQITQTPPAQRQTKTTSRRHTDTQSTAQPSPQSSPALASPPTTHPSSLPGSEPLTTGQPTTSQPHPPGVGAATGEGLTLPPGAVLAPGMPPLPQPSSEQRPRRKPQRAALDTGHKSKKAGNTVFMIVLIFIFFTNILPRIVDALSPDDEESFIETMTQESVVEEEDETKSIADPPKPIPLGNSIEFGPTIAPEQAGSRATPARPGQRLVIGDVAITVDNIQRGDEAARAAWDLAPPGYEYVLLRLDYENPDNVPIEFSPVVINDKNEGLYPEPLMQGVDFRLDAKPDRFGKTTGDVLFLLKSDELYTLALQSYDEKYPVVFYALP